MSLPPPGASRPAIYVQIKQSDEVIFERTFSDYPLSLGRSTQNEITISQFSWVSRKHLFIDWVDGQFHLAVNEDAHPVVFQGEHHRQINFQERAVIRLGTLSIFFKAVARAALSSNSKSPQPLTQWTAYPAPPTRDPESVPTDATAPWLQVEELPEKSILKEISRNPSPDNDPAPQTPLSNSNSEPQYGPWPDIMKTPQNRRVLEMTVFLDGRLHQSSIFRNGERIRLDEGINLPLTSLPEDRVFFDAWQVMCHFTATAVGKIVHEDGSAKTLKELGRRQNGNRAAGFYYRLLPNQTCTLELPGGAKIHLRQIPNPDPMFADFGESALPRENLRQHFSLLGSRGWGFASGSIGRGTAIAAIPAVVLISVILMQLPSHRVLERGLASRSKSPNDSRSADDNDQVISKHPKTTLRKSLVDLSSSDTDRAGHPSATESRNPAAVSQLPKPVRVKTSVDLKETTAPVRKVKPK